MSDSIKAFFLNIAMMSTGSVPRPGRSPTRNGGRDMPSQITR